MKNRILFERGLRSMVRRGIDFDALKNLAITFIVGFFLVASPARANHLVVASPLVANPPVIDGVVGFGEWPNSGQLNLQNGFIRVVNDGIRLYILIDLLNDSGNDTATDYFWLTFDVNHDSAITPNVDLNYGTLPTSGNMRYQYYLGPGSWTGTQPATFSSKAQGFDCFFGDGSATWTFPFFITCNTHRVWELAIDLAEIGAAPGGSVRMGLRVGSSLPAFTEDVPANFYTNFTDLITVNLAAAALPASNPLASIALESNPIEVTQAIQTRTNTLPLVANKTSVARVYVDANIFGLPGLEPSIVTLYGNKGGVDLPGSPFVKLHMAPTSIDRAQLSHTANFALPGNWDDGTVEFKAVARKLTGAPSSSGPITLSFTPKQTPTYWIVPINTGTTTAPVLVNNTEITSQENYFRAIYPLANVNFVRKPWQDVGTSSTATVIGDLNNYYNNTLVGWFITVLFTGQAPFDLPAHVYGFMPSGGGNSDPTWFSSGGGHVAYGYRGTSLEGTMAHETNHNLDRSSNGTWGRHVPAGCGAVGPDPLWPYANDDIQEVGFDTRPPWKAIPSTYPDIMSYCQSGSLPTKWISPYRWENLFNVFTTVAAAAPLAASFEVAAVLPKIQTVYYVSGHVNINGTGALQPILVQPGVPTESITPGEFTLELLDTGGASLLRVPFNLSFVDIEGEKRDTAFFNFQLPAVQGVGAVVLRFGNEILSMIKVSRNAPRVQLITPNGGEKWSGIERISWEASDADGDPLSFNLLYSPDEGRSWLPLASGLQGNSFMVDSAILRGSKSARLRVIASDGFNNAQDDSDGLFAILPHPPTVYLNLPADAAAFLAGETIHFEGDATDTEDAALPDSAFAWFYGDIAFGQGRNVDAALPGGNHTITLLVTDSDGQIGKATIQIQVGKDSDGDGIFDDKDNCINVANADQRDTDGDGYGNRCDADFDNNGIVNFADLAYIKAHFGTNDPNADLDGNGIVNFADLAIAKSLFGKAPGPSGLKP